MLTLTANLLLEEITKSTAAKRSFMTESTAAKRALTFNEVEVYQIAVPTNTTESYKTLEDPATLASSKTASMDKSTASLAKKSKQQEGKN